MTKQKRRGLCGLMAVEVALVSLIGSGISLIEPKETTFKIKARRLSAGFFLAFFAGQDVAALIQHFLNFNVSEGATVFFTAYIGSTFLDRVIVLINAVSIKRTWGKK